MKKHSILRWSGSKAKLLPELIRLAPKSFNSYIEPFAGSACLYFSLEPSQAILGDINPEVMDVYRAISLDPDALSDMLESIPKTREAYYLLRAINPSDLDIYQRAARLLFLMKACFNGVYRTNRRGEFNVPMGNRVFALPSREQLSQACHLIRKALLVTGGFSETLAYSKPGDWVYVDPPYRSTGRYRGEYGYAANFLESDLQSLVTCLKELASEGRFVMMSYAYDEELKMAFDGWRVNEVTTARTVAGRGATRKTVRELILTNY